MARSSRLPTPPGTRGLPIVGDSFEFIRSPSAFVEARRARHGPIFVAHMLGKPTVFTTGVEANEWIYAGENEYLENEWSPAVLALLGKDCLALIHGERHKQRRKLLAPHFRRVGMGACIPGLHNIARKHVRRWHTDAELGPVAMVPRIRAAAFETAANYLLGDVGELGVPLDEFSRDFELLVAGLFVPLALALPGSKFAAAKAARARLMTALDDLVMRRDADSRRGPDVLSTLLEVQDERGELLDRDTIVDELLLFLFAGHDTTVTSTSNVIYHLCVHPKVAAQARAEQAKLPDARFTLESIRAMTYLDAVINESMRLIPPIGNSFRVMTKEAELDGYRIPAGWRIAVGPRSVHFDARYYPEPQRFEPDRWLSDEPRPPFSYIPFGGGPRACIGQHFALLEMHVMLALLLREFEWDLAPGQDLSFTEIPTPLPRGGLILDLRSRAYSDA
jgi:cytochrome P450